MSQNHRPPEFPDVAAGSSGDPWAILRRSRENARQVREDFEETKASVAETWERLLAKRVGIFSEQDARQAALNLLEGSNRRRSYPSTTMEWVSKWQPAQSGSAWWACRNAW